jgi:hypothetical protein
VQPVTGFHVASVHSIVDACAIVLPFHSGREELCCTQV